MLGLYTEWKFAPFKADSSFAYLVSHAAELKPLTQIMIVAGAFFAYWLGKDGGYRSLRLGGDRKLADVAKHGHFRPRLIDKSQEADRCRRSHPTVPRPGPTTRH